MILRWITLCAFALKRSLNRPVVHDRHLRCFSCWKWTLYAVKFQLPTCSECGRRIEDQNLYHRQRFYDIQPQPQITRPSERRPQSATTRGSNRRGVVGRHLRPSSAGKDRRFHAEHRDGWIGNVLHQQKERRRHLPSVPLKSKPETQNVYVNATKGEEKQSKKEHDFALGDKENEMLCHDSMKLFN